MKTDINTAGLDDEGVLAADRKQLPRTNVTQTFFNITKAIVGAGSFALPWAFMNMGSWGGLIAIVLLAALSMYTMLMLLRVRRIVSAQTGNNSVTYPDIARYVFGKPGAVLAYSLTMFASMGVAGAYIVFVASTLHSLWPKVTQTDFSLLMGLAVIPLALLRSYHVLSFSSILGTIALTMGMVSTMVDGVETTTFPPLSSLPFFHWRTFALSFGSVAFLFCIHFLILPIERSMKNPLNFRISLGWSIAFVTTTNAVFGFVGFMFYQQQTCSIVVLNLANSAFIWIVKLCLCLDLYCSYAIVFAPGREIMELTFITPKFGWVNTQRNVLRVLLVCFTVLVAQIKQFGTITNIVGGLSMCTLGFVVPPLMLLRLAWVPPAGTTGAASLRHPLVQDGPYTVNSRAAGNAMMYGAAAADDDDDNAAGGGEGLQGKGEGAKRSNSMDIDSSQVEVQGDSNSVLGRKLRAWEVAICIFAATFGVAAAALTTYVSIDHLVTGADESSCPATSKH